MPAVKVEMLPIQSQYDLVDVRRAVRTRAAHIGMSILDQTKIVTAASELARNALVYGGGGTVMLEELEDGMRICLRLTFEDHGPGIPDVDKALTDGFTTGGGLGLGLGGSKRLVHDFEISSVVSEGTRVRVTRWK